MAEVRVCSPVHLRDYFLAAASGVKVYFPSEWGYDYDTLSIQGTPFEGKQAHRKAAEALGLKTVAVAVGAFYETFRSPAFGTSSSLFWGHRSSHTKHDCRLRCRRRRLGDHWRRIQAVCADRAERYCTICRSCCDPGVFGALVVSFETSGVFIIEVSLNEGASLNLG